MNGVDSVETLVITRRSDADTAAVEATVKNAEVVFFAGGDQCNYTTLFKGTRLERAVETVYARGGAIGGTSAGMAIQGEFVYDACSSKSGATSIDILANPYHPSATFTYDFFAWNDMGDTLTDQHFVTRDRMGRLLGFLARQVKDGKAPMALGVAADEKTSIVVDAAGVATVMGTGAAYFVLADHFPGVAPPGGTANLAEQVQSGLPLTYTRYQVWKRRPPQTFNLRNRPGKGDYEIDVVGGVITYPSNPYQ
jgi:cyanophycinase